METLPTRNQIHVGDAVYVETKQNQGTDNLTSGIVAEILTSTESHPHGIKIRLEDGQIGRVKKTKNSIVTNTDIFEDLEKRELPKSEDVHNEFKKYYQYDVNMEGVLNNGKTKAVENMSHKAQQRIAEAVAAFANSWEGGFLYMGVDDQGNKCGLEKDLKFGNFANYTDDFANHLNSRLIEYLKKKSFISTNLKIKFREIENVTICVIQILPADEPIHLHIDGQVIFPVRGPAPRVQRLTVLEQLEYIKKRFPGV